MVIVSNKKLSDIKTEFHSLFPYLRIEFYSGHHEVGKGSPKERQLDGDKTIKELIGKELNENFTIQPSLSVNELELYFDRHLGLNVQVFRKSGNLWMQTTATDHWTLEKQNRKGGSSHYHFNEKYNS